MCLADAMPSCRKKGNLYCVACTREGIDIIITIIICSWGFVLGRRTVPVNTGRGTTETSASCGGQVLTHPHLIPLLSNPLQLPLALLLPLLAPLFRAGVSQAVFCFTGLMTVPGIVSMTNHSAQSKKSRAGGGEARPSQHEAPGRYGATKERGEGRLENPLGRIPFVQKTSAGRIRLQGGHEKLGGRRDAMDE